MNYIIKKNFIYNNKKKNKNSFKFILDLYNFFLNIIKLIIKFFLAYKINYKFLTYFKNIKKLDI